MANNPPAPELPDFVIQNLADAIINKLNSLDLAEREHANFRRLLQSELKIEPAFLDEYENKGMLDRETFAANLRVILKQQANLVETAKRLWGRMDWGLPFGVVYAEEQEESKGLRVGRLADLTLAMVVEPPSHDPKQAEKAAALRAFLEGPSVGGIELQESLATYKQKPSKENRENLLLRLRNALGKPETALRVANCVKGPNPYHGTTVGLALSGGGIRSGTFGLGVLQALADLEKLRRIDYLSTVSGGGYIGSWLMGWIKRVGFSQVERWLRPDRSVHAERVAPQIEFLRDYSNYLTPQLGLFSADTWASIVIYFRNLTLNLAILIPLFLALLLLPYVAVFLPWEWHDSAALIGWSFQVLAFSAIAYTLWRGSTFHREEDPLQPSTPAKKSGQSPPLLNRPSREGDIGEGLVLGLVCLPLFAGTFLITFWLGAHKDWWDKAVIKWAPPVVIILAIIAWAVFASAARPSLTPTRLVLGLLSYALVSVAMVFWSVAALCRHFAGASFTAPVWRAHALVWAIPLALLATLLAGWLQVGLMGLIFPNELREWTARLGAWILILTIGWMALFAISLYGPLLALWLSGWVGRTLTVAWVVHTIAGVLSAYSSKVGKPGSGGWLNTLARTAPLVFLLGLFVLLSLGIYKLVPQGTHAEKKAEEVTANASRAVTPSTETSSWSGWKAREINCCKLSRRQEGESFRHLAKDYWGTMTEKQAWGCFFPAVTLGLLLLGLLLSLRVDVNDFSMHLFYRNRLVRCYLGASRPDQFGANPCRRRPNPFTGFDMDDDFHLVCLTWDTSKVPEERNPCNRTLYCGPYPILNATLNLTHGERLAWQERKAECFTFTPLYCGGTQNDKDAYRPTLHYAYPGGPFLGTALSISGAAVSPYVGFHSSWAAGCLLTVFNARLSQWLPNPSQNRWRKPGPPLGLIYLIREFFGLMNDTSKFVCLSDGGHFENLGIYELVRRHCKLILACDATEDSEYKFEALGNSIRRCRADFGVDIDINVDNLRPKSEPGQSGDGDIKKSSQHCAVGIISYDNVWPNASPGILIYVKASLTGDEPADVLEYKMSHLDFPHDSTADQWFSESQFESYRKLGLHIIEQGKSIEYKLRQKTPVLDLLKMDEWRKKETSKELDRYLAKELGGVYQP